ncbi:PREDICTED: NADH dehydrogenase [ubiquinone] 1 beta subcomplex subunit 8, mitochondrial [Gekko japonicus]|uniref:NADH dehydrogenase [ubiquinone] 1 beta subcomplex subunit 8, mitochondrial n=1 Tax=Gekko japonicus TaxID=146911 RepID=A0ABM1JZ70_GEKJA|nr:PREDICTED: NADH dehydrogenase [ubiquinone] 1 beta subcomplex subunit 8, mitochondrial [Gekko japonicus]
MALHILLKIVPGTGCPGEAQSLLEKFGGGPRPRVVLYACACERGYIGVVLDVFHSYGDYPKLPDRSQQERDPYYSWDHSNLRRNYGEPLHWDFDMFLRTRVDTTPTVLPWHTMRNYFLGFVGFMFFMFGLGAMYPSYQPVGPKQYPYSNLYLETSGDPNQEVPEVKHYEI